MPRTAANERATSDSGSAAQSPGDVGMCGTPNAPTIVAIFRQLAQAGVDSWKTKSWFAKCCWMRLGRCPVAHELVGPLEAALVSGGSVDGEHDRGGVTDVGERMRGPSRRVGKGSGTHASRLGSDLPFPLTLHREPELVFERLVVIRYGAGAGIHHHIRDHHRPGALLPLEQRDGSSARPARGRRVLSSRRSAWGRAASPSRARRSSWYAALESTSNSTSSTGVLTMRITRTVAACHPCHSLITSLRVGEVERFVDRRVGEHEHVEAERSTTGASGTTTAPRSRRPSTPRGSCPASSITPLPSNTCHTDEPTRRGSADDAPGREAMHLDPHRDQRVARRSWGS